MKNILPHFIVFSLIFCGFKANAGNPITSTIWRTADFTANNVLVVEDDRYTDMQGEISGNPGHHARQFDGFYNKKVTNRIVFKIDQFNKSHQPLAFAVTIKVKVETKAYEGGGDFEERDHDKYLTINYNPEQPYSGETVYDFNDEVTPGQYAGYYMKMTLCSMSGLPANCNLLLYTEIETERYYKFDFTNPQYNALDLSELDADIIDNSLRISWEPRAWAEQYDLEWYHVSNVNLRDNPSPLDETQLIFSPNDFRFNATRVTVKNNSFFDIPLVYTDGYIVFRVRGYGRSSSDNYATLIPGPWTMDEPCPDLSSCDRLEDLTNGYYLISGSNVHEKKLNWQYDISFAEEAKHKVAVNYFDGTLRNRQTIVKSKILDRVIVSEKIYDYEGRPAIEVLPAPSAESNLGYKRNFNLNPDGGVYNRRDFDEDQSGGLCEPKSFRGMKETSGSSFYYSPDNNLASGLSGSNAYLAGFEKYLPDAGKYPFQQTVFTPDNTGRVKIKTGVGADFNLKSFYDNGQSGRVSRYFYGKPYQEELDKLFGYEVGNALFYNKNMVIDPNGQVSVSYLNPAGQVIATNLAGADPAELTSLREESGEQDALSIDLLNVAPHEDENDYTRGSENNLDLNTRSLKLNRTILVDKEQEYAFGYENKGTIANIEPCEGVKFCYDCVFDLTISLTDECGNEKAAGIGSNGGQDVIHATIGEDILNDVNSSDTLPEPVYSGLDRCSGTGKPSLVKNIEGTTVGSDWHTPALPVGAYQLKKELTVNQKVMDYYTKDYLANNECLKTLEQFRDDYAFLEDIYQCDIDCDECKLRVGDLADYRPTTSKPGYPILSLEQYQELLDECDRRCSTESNKCMAAYQAMLVDMAPNGQYGGVRERAIMDGGVMRDLSSAEPPNPYVHALSVYNDANFLPIKASFNGRLPNWRNPYTESGQEHYYDEAGNIDYIIVETDDGINFTPETGLKFLDNGVYKTEPQYLQKIDDFLAYYKPSWAKSLVMYHPEYNMYVLCVRYAKSNTFDETWMSLETEASASGEYEITDGFYNPSGTVGNNDAFDPFFIAAENPSLTTEEYNNMYAMMFNYANTGETIWAVAARLVIDPNSNLNICSYSPVPFGDFTTKQKDEYWRIFKGLYMSLKQRVQEKHFAKLSIQDPTLYCYNGCIGNARFDNTKYGFLKTAYCNPDLYGWAVSAPWFYVYYWSQYFNFEQPCNWSRAYLYLDKTPRFPGTTDILSLSAYTTAISYDEDEDKFYVPESESHAQAILNEVKHNAEINTFNQCGKCPVAQQLESILHKLAFTNADDNKKITQLTPLLACGVSSDDNFNMIDPELHEKLGGGQLTWIPAVSVDLNTLTATLGACTITLTFPTGETEDAAVRFGNIIGLYNLKYKYTGGNKNTSFEITAYINPLNPENPAFDNAETRHITLTGNASCLDLANCTFTPVCQPTQTATDLLNLFNVLLLEPDFSACTGTTPTPTPEFVHNNNSAYLALNDPNILTRFVGGLTPNLKYEFDRAIVLGSVDVNQVWKWNTTYNGSGSNPDQMVATIYGSGVNAGGSCNISFDIEESSYKMEHIKKFISIMPDPGNLPNGFILTALVNDGTNTPEYIKVKGQAGCFIIGDCKNVPGNAYNPNTYLPKKTYCQRFPFNIETTLLQQINCNQMNSRFIPIDPNDENEETGIIFNAEAGKDQCDLPCPIQFELPPIPGITLRNILALKSIKPDADRPSPKGYFTAIATLNDGRFMAIKGFATCLPDAPCGECEASELITSGNIPQDVESENFEDNQYTEVSSVSSLSNGEYCFVPNIPGGSGLHAVTDHTQYPGSKFIVAKSGTDDGSLKKLWEQKIDAGDLEQEAQYEFSFYYINPMAAPAQVNGITINNELILKVNNREVTGRTVVYETSPQWYKVSYMFRNDNAEDMIVSLNVVENHADNYIAVDDISLRKICGCKDLNITRNGNFDNDEELPDDETELMYQPTVSISEGEYTITTAANMSPSMPAMQSQLRAGSSSFIYFKIATMTEKVVWKQEVNVITGKEYTFSAWWAVGATYSLAPGDAMEFALKVNGTVIQRIRANVPNMWHIMQEKWTNHTSSKALLEIVAYNINTYENVYAALDEINFTERCDPGSCPTPILLKPDPVPCTQIITSIINHNAKVAYEAYLDAEKRDFQRQLVEKCLNVYETFQMEYVPSEQHYTLYYYDQAGNLVRTIPPNGVKPVENAGDLLQVKKDRVNKNRTIFTDHTYASTYKFNSLGQVVEQSMPDQENFNASRVYEGYAFNAVSNNGLLSSTAYFAADDGIAVGTASSSGTNGVIYRGLSISKQTAALEWGDITSVITTGTGSSFTGAYAVNKQRQLLYSSADGVTWFTKATPSGAELVQVYEIDGRIYIANKAGEVWSTNDKGNTWKTEAHICVQCEIKQVAFSVQSSTDYAGIALAADHRRFYYTSASGAWKQGATDKVPDIKSISMTPVYSTLIASGVNGTIIRSKDNGLNWEKVSTSALYDFTKMAFTTDLNGVAISDGELYKTTNGGATWTVASPGMFGSSYYPVDLEQVGSTVYIVNNYGHLFSYDRDDNFAIVNTSLSPTHFITSLSIKNGNNIVMGCMSGLIYTSFSFSATPVSAIFSGTAFTENIKDLHFGTLYNGVALADNGKLYHFTISGVNTYNHNEVTAASGTYVSIYFPEPDKGYAVTANGDILSIDFALPDTKWKLQKKGISLAGIRALWAKDGSVQSPMVLVGDNGSIQTTGFYTGSWVNRSNSVKQPAINGVKISHNGTSYIATSFGANGLFSTSTDNGSTWQMQTTATKADIYDALLHNDAGTVKGFALADGNVFLTSSNGGSWSIPGANPLPSGFSSRKIVLKQYGTTKQAVVAGLNGTYKEVHQVDLGTTPGSSVKLATSGFPNISGEYNSLATHLYTTSGTTDRFWLFAGSKREDTQADQSGCMNDNLSLYRYADVTTSGSVTSQQAEFISTCIFPKLRDVTILGKSNSAIAVGEDGVVLKTNDKGLSWFRKDGNAGLNHLNSVSFFDELNGAAVGAAGTLIITKDGGETWTKYTKGTETLNDVLLLNAGFGIAVGDNVSAYKVDGGNFATDGAWVSVTAALISASVPSGTKLVSSVFSDTRNGFITTGGTSCVLHRKPSSSVVWSVGGAVFSGGTERMTSAVMIDLKKAFVVSNEGRIYKSVNTGLSWAQVPASGSYLANLVNISTPDNKSYYIASITGTNQSAILRFSNEDNYSSRFYYDKLGRLVLSQNSKQFNKAGSDRYYSYTLYDFKGRIVESGQVGLPAIIEEATFSGNKVYEYGIIDYTRFENLVNSLSVAKRTEVTHTWYDSENEDMLGALPSNFRMLNLRSRVTHMAYYETFSSSVLDFDNAIHYTYDAHGNVTSLLHENRKLPSVVSGISGIAFKRIDYEYDLLSGKVNKVIYQLGKPDCFFHKYEYDDENKLTAVFTSNNGVIWQQDAKYFYYMHGPLARIELGNDRIQGIDYAYTIQGWLKGVNSGTLQPGRDIGKDGLAEAGNLNADFARDEFGFSLGYYQNDYTAIRSSGTSHFEACSSFAHDNLYNGNITSMVTAVRQFMNNGTTDPQGMAYAYDQLNRLRATTPFAGSGASTVVNNNSWTGVSAKNAFKESFTYDANGNIKTLNRNDETGSAMDQLSYVYANAGNGYAKNTNRLVKVSDAITTALITDDIESGQTGGTGTAGMASDNYAYDELGNLVKDAAEKITNIQWTLTGKIKSVTFDPSSGKNNLEFYYDPAGNRIMKVAIPQGTPSEDQCTYTVYSRDAQGNIMSTYTIKGGVYYQDNVPIYGSSRLGEYNPNTYSDCAAYFNISEVTSTENWARDFMRNTLGFNTTLTNYVLTQWNATILPNYFGATFTSLDGTGSALANKRYMENWARVMCRLRAYSGFSDNDASIVNVIDAYSAIPATYLTNINVYDQQAWIDIENYLASQFIPNELPDLLDAGKKDIGVVSYVKGSRRFELSNHLGNVMSVVSDRKNTGATESLKIAESTFDVNGDPEGWSKILSTEAWALNSGLIAVNAPLNGGIQKTISTTPLKQHTLTFTLINTAAALDVQITDGSTTLSTTTYTTAGDKTITFTTSSASSTVIKFIKKGSAGTAVFALDNIVLRETNKLVVSYYKADLQEAQDYYAFGSPMRERKYQYWAQTTIPLNQYFMQGGQSHSGWADIASASSFYDTPTDELNVQVSANNAGTEYNFATPSDGRTIDINFTVKTELAPALAFIYDVNNVEVYSQHIPANSMGAAVSFSYASVSNTHRIKVVTLDNAKVLINGQINSWTNSGGGSASQIGSWQQIITNGPGDGAGYTFTTPDDGRLLTLNSSITTQAAELDVLVYDATNALINSQHIPANATTPVNLTFNGYTGSHTIKVERSTPAVIVLEPSGHTQPWNWTPHNGGITFSGGPQQNIITTTMGDGAKYMFNIPYFTGQMITFKPVVDASTFSGDVFAEVFNNMGAPVAPGVLIPSGSIGIPSLSFNAYSAGIYELRLTAMGVSPSGMFSVIGLSIEATLTNDMATVNSLDVLADYDKFMISGFNVASTVAVSEVARKGYGYRFGFNGKENDLEIKGSGNQQDYGMRVYDTRLAKFLSVDPLKQSYPFYSTYQFASNTPIMAIDLDGLESFTAINGKVLDGPWVMQKVNQKIVDQRTNQNIQSMSGKIAIPKLPAKSTAINKTETPKEEKKSSSIEFNISIGAQAGLMVKRALGIDANAGSVQLFSAKSETQQTRFGETTTASFDYAGKDKQYNFTAGAGFTTPLLAGGYDYSQSRGANGGTNSPIADHNFSGMVGMPEIGLGVSGTSSIRTNSQMGTTQHSSSSGGELGFKISFIIGIELKIKSGTTTTEQKGSQ